MHLKFVDDGADSAVAMMMHTDLRVGYETELFSYIRSFLEQSVTDILAARVIYKRELYSINSLITGVVVHSELCI